MRVLDRVPSVLVSAVVMSLTGATVLLAMPHTNVTFIAERWRDHIEDRAALFPDFLAHHQLEGENISAIRKSLGNPDVPDSSSNSENAIDIYYFAPNRLLQLIYDRTTGIINRFDTVSIPGAESGGTLEETLPPEAQGFDNTIIDWSVPQKADAVAAYTIDGKARESRAKLKRRVDDALKEIANESFSAVELQNGSIFVCADLSTEARPMGTLPSETWIVDPISGRKGRGPNLKFARYEPSLLVLQDGRVLIAGGSGDDLDVSRECEIYDPKTQQIMSIGRMILPRHEPGMGQLQNGDVLVVSGMSESGLNDQSNMTSTVEIIRFKADRVDHSIVGALKLARKNADVLPYGDSGAIIVGGDLGFYNGHKLHAGADLFTGRIANATPIGSKQAN